MKLLQLFQVMESNDKFQLTANTQRGAPEQVMSELQMAYGGGVYSYVVEHVGDLTHRMSEKFGYLKGQQNTVYDKVEKTLRTLTHRYGFEREMKENMQNNYQFLKDKGRFEGTFDEFVANIKSLSEQYAKEHEKVPVWNEPQKWARNAAVALGYWQFHTAINYLTKLEGIVKLPREEYERLVSQITLSEAPIKDIQTYGMNKPLDAPPMAKDLPTYDTGSKLNFKPTMPEPDAKMLSNPKYWNVVKKKFAKSQYTYNLYFANFNMQSMTRKGVGLTGTGNKNVFSSAFTNLLSDHSGIVDYQTLSDNWGLDIKPESNVISSLFISNADVSRVSMRMTPWIMAHRLGHAMDDEIQRNDDDDPYHTLSGYFNNNKRNQIRMLLDPENSNETDFHHRNNFAGYNVEEPDLERSLFFSIPYESLLTMKTARTGNLLIGEAFPELLAQYILQNKITLARPLKPVDEDDLVKFSNGYELEDKYISYSAFAEYEFISEAVDKVESEVNAVLKTKFDEWASNGVIFLSP